MPVQHAVIVPQIEFEDLPASLGLELARIAQDAGGFTVVLKETGQPVGDRLDDWFIGVVAAAWRRVLGAAGESGRGTY